MGYRKFKADGIFNGYELMGGEHVLITDAFGVIVELVDKVDEDGEIEEFRGILCPGFINCHCHLELSHLRGLIPERTGLVDFILKVVNERHFEEGVIRQAIENAEQEMWLNGIAGVGDICNNSLTIAQKAGKRLRYHNFIEVSGFSPKIATDRFEKAISVLDSFHSTLNTQHSTLSPHAPYSVSPELFALINNLQDNRVLSIHNQESVAEDQLFEKGEGEFLRLFREMDIDISFFQPSGKSSLQSWLPYFNRNQSLILVHDVTTSAEDMRFIELQTTNHKLQTFICLCPNANLYITGILPDVYRFVEEGSVMVIGTDSLASNQELSFLGEIKTLQRHFPDLELATILRWATLNGARALQMDDELGSFERGKKPGVVLIEGCDGIRLSSEAKARRVL